MQAQNKKRSIWRPLLIGAVILATSTIIASYGVKWFFDIEPAPSATANQRLRLSGRQFLLNWQSFPGREVTVEYCTVLVSGSGDITCRVFDGQREMGQINIDTETLDPTSAEWAIRTCTTTSPARRCSSRVTGTIRKGPDGRAVLDHVTIEV